MPGGGGGGRVSAKLKRPHNKFWGSFYDVDRSFSHIDVEGGAKGGGGVQSFTLS